MTIGGWGIELTGTAIVAIAIPELARLEFPIDMFHDISFLEPVQLIGRVRKSP
jgi:hypothetical protein